MMLMQNPWRCPVCGGRGFGRRRDLVRHVAEEHDVAPEEASRWVEARVGAGLSGSVRAMLDEHFQIEAIAHELHERVVWQWETERAIWRELETLASRIRGLHPPVDEIDLVERAGAPTADTGLLYEVATSIDSASGRRQNRRPWGPRRRGAPSRGIGAAQRMLRAEGFTRQKAEELVASFGPHRR